MYTKIHTKMYRMSKAEYSLQHCNMCNKSVLIFYFFNYVYNNVNLHKC